MPIQIIRADARHLPLRDNSVHCVVTSPPYWGLRKYAGEQEIIWDSGFGTRDSGKCEHEWATEVHDPQCHGDDGSGGNLEGGKATQAATRHLSALTGQCRLCGAWRGAFGLEPTIEMYVEHTVEILREIRRVLRPDGVCFWNIGDSYSGSGKGQNADGTWNANSGEKQKTNVGTTLAGLPTGNPKSQIENLKSKDLCLIPFRVALAAQADGWWVRSDIIWGKPNPMPESVSGWRWETHRVKRDSGLGARDSGRGKESQRMGTFPDRPQQDHNGKDFKPSTEWTECPGCEKCDRNGGLVLRQWSWRPTDAYEHILMLTKSEQYFCDAEAVREACSEYQVSRILAERSRGMVGLVSNKSADEISASGSSLLRTQKGCRDETGRNLRNVWTFATQPYKGAHFATFPEELVRRCIAAGTSERGCCPKCGAPWVRMVKRESLTAHDGDTASAYGKGSNPNRIALLRQAARERGAEYAAKSETLGWRASCYCPSPESRVASPAIVLDPFAGSGTVGEVAYKMGRSAVLIDLAYQDLQRERIPPMAFTERTALSGRT